MPEQTGNPMVRMAFNLEDLTAIAEHLDGWNHPAYFRIRARLAEHGVNINSNRVQEGAHS